MSASMITPRLIGFTGAVGAGKDAAANVLKRAGWMGLAFADALRIEVAEAWAVDIGLFARRETKDAPTPQLAVEWCTEPGFLRWAAYQGHSLHDRRTPRWLMQQWGSFRRCRDPHYWVSQVDQWIAYQRRAGHLGLVISDVRQPNEADMLHQRGGLLVRVHRPDLPPLPAAEAGHESERHHLLPVDADVHNDGDLQHLAAEVARVLMALDGLPQT